MVQFTTDRTRQSILSCTFLSLTSSPDIKCQYFSCFSSIHVCSDGADCVTDHTSMIPRPFFLRSVQTVTSAAAETDETCCECQSDLSWRRLCAVFILKHWNHNKTFIDILWDLAKEHNRTATYDSFHFMVHLLIISLIHWFVYWSKKCLKVQDDVLKCPKIFTKKPENIHIFEAFDLRYSSTE